LLCLDCGTSTASSRRRGHGRNQPRRLAGDPVISSRMRPRAKKVSSHRGDASCVAKGCADSCHQPRSCLVNFRIGSLVEKVGVLKKWEKHTISKTACSQAGQSCERSKASEGCKFSSQPVQIRCGSPEPEAEAPGTFRLLPRWLPFVTRASYSKPLPSLCEDRRDRFSMLTGFARVSDSGAPWAHHTNNLVWDKPKRLSPFQSAPSGIQQQKDGGIQCEI
jgi:hypothetical protein